MSKWAVRRAETRDADNLAACIDAAYATYNARITDLPSVSENCAEEISAHQVWVAELGGQIVGGLVMVAEAHFMRVANLAVHPDHKGAGLGRSLMALAETEAVKQGYHEMRLTTHTAMPENIRLYVHLGWTTEQTVGNKVSMKKPV